MNLSQGDFYLGAIRCFRDVSADSSKSTTNTNY
jgi:hypothetical protein